MQDKTHHIFWSDFLGTEAGQKVIVNPISKNKKTIREVLR